jgi:hypothetical protein
MLDGPASMQARVYIIIISLEIRKIKNKNKKKKKKKKLGKCHVCPDPGFMGFS